MYNAAIVGSSSSSYAVTATAFSLAFLAGSVASASVVDEPLNVPENGIYVEHVAQASHSGLSEMDARNEHAINRELFDLSGEVFAKLASQPSQLDPDVAAVVYENFWDLCEA